MNKKRHQFTCSSMMLPEHRLGLDRRQREIEQTKYRRPLLDEQEHERFQYLLEQSLQEGSPLTLTVLKENGFRRIVGTVIKLDFKASCLRLRTDDSVETVLVAEITGAESKASEI